MIREHCGIFGISGNPNAVKNTYLGLYALQHRGEESAGIASAYNNEINVYKGLGLVADVFDIQKTYKISGASAIGHVRYSTTGNTTLSNAQPIIAHYKDQTFAAAHNGNIVNAGVLKKRLIKEGIKFETTSDSEVFLKLLIKNLKYGFEEAIKKSANIIKGAFSIIILTNKGKIAAIKDCNGFRPLCLGKTEKNYIFASETCALDINGARLVKELDPGEILIVNKNKIKSVKNKKRKKSFCIFEYIYFARPDSIIFDKTVYNVRKKFGEKLAAESSAKADMVIPLPDSGNYAALGYSQATDIPFELAMIKNQYIGRTFIQPEQIMREIGIKIKLNPAKEILKNKEIAIVDDSLVRGSTIKMTTKILRKAGVKKIHLKIASPAHKYPCPYGIDFSDKKELFAANKTIDEMKEFFKIDSIAYLSIAGLLEATGIKEPENFFCKACFDGIYPVKFDIGAGNNSCV
ncbi:MAG: amidophosphoribosyltransferase [Deltaproteobacteria bacterium]|nr:amidophosphoribosyltransferase [Deltaproteobacteria bacterium]